MNEQNDMRKTEIFSRPRRIFLGAAGVCALILPTGFRQARAAGSGEAIVQLDEPTQAAFIERAFAMRQQATDSGDQPYGAIVVRDGVIVGQSPSLVVINNDPTAHAEMAAIRDAARRTGSRDLSGATLYSSSRPCPMCEAAAYWAGIGLMVHGRAAIVGGQPELCG